MNTSINKLNKQKKIFWYVFLVSFIVFIALNVVFYAVPSINSITDNYSEKTLENNQLIKSIPKVIESAANTNFAIILSTISLLTSITALLGFFSTSVLAWRKEKRDELYSKLELRKKELEIQKLQEELNINEKSDTD